jgi:hypothetical protein
VDASFEIVRDIIGIIPWLDSTHLPTIMLRDVFLHAFYSYLVRENP